MYVRVEELNPRNGCEGEKVRDMVPSTKARAYDCDFNGKAKRFAFA